jgi:hypothetical protein
MKTLKFKLTTLIIFILIIGLGTGCKTTIQLKAKTPPPGQVKKATGSKSAKPFAPGQQKKKKN